MPAPGWMETGGRPALRHSLDPGTLAWHPLSSIAFPLGLDTGPHEEITGLPPLLSKLDMITEAQGLART